MLLLLLLLIRRRSKHEPPRPPHVETEVDLRRPEVAVDKAALGA
jgi:hypothetical protein